MLKLCITFDYEPFLAGSAMSYDEQLFNPTYSLLKILKTEGVYATFFADTCSYLVLKELGQLTYCEGFSKQIRNMRKTGNDVQLHIHPNWYSCKMSSEGPIMSYENYKIHDYGFDRKKELNAYKIIKDGKNLLEKEIKTIDPEYKCIAYRAGGFCIRPEEDLINALIDNGILIDSSVAIGQYTLMDTQDYDFRKVPPKLYWWSDGKNILRESKRDKKILEVAIGYGKNNIAKYFGLPVWDLHVTGRGNYGMVAKEVEPKYVKGLHLLKRAKRILCGKGILSLDSRGFRVLLRDIEYLYNRFHCESEDHYTAIICHPNRASREVMNNMRRFITNVKKDNKFEFTTFTEIAKDMGLV